MKIRHNPTKPFEFRLSPRSFVSWVIGHVRPSFSVLPPKEDEEDIEINSISDMWEFAKDRIEFRLGFKFNF